MHGLLCYSEYIVDKVLHITTGLDGGGGEYHLSTLVGLN